MLIKNGRMIMDRILKPLQLKIRIRRAPAAVFAGKLCSAVWRPTVRSGSAS